MTDLIKSTPSSSLRLSWTEQKGKLKAKFSNLIDSDLQFEGGKRDEMLAKLQTKLGKTKVELTAIIAAL